MATTTIPPKLLLLYDRKPRIINRWGSIGIPALERFISRDLLDALGPNFEIRIVPANAKTQKLVQTAVAAKTTGG